MPDESITQPTQSPQAPKTIKGLWWQKGILYQIYPRSFKDSNGDGIGDLRGIIEKLDYLSDTLGIDAIWLSPFYPSPMRDFGYDISNYTDVDPIFGDLVAFDELVMQAHQRKLQVIVDFVPNHTSDQHSWFIESRSSRSAPRRDWYVWADAKADGSPPNNWLSVFGGSSWEWDAATGQYYLHSFLKEQPDLNWRNLAVRTAMLDVLRFWLERGVDGFRIDVAHFIMKDPALRDNPPNPTPEITAYKPLGNYDSLLHVNDSGHADIHGVLQDIRQLLDAYSAERPRFAVAEIHIFDWAVWATYYGTQYDELHMPFNFWLIGAAWDAQRIRAIVDGMEAALPPGAWPNYVVGNHDEHRIMTKRGPAQARIAMMLLLTLRGTPTLYYGDEIGMHDVDVPSNLAQDPWGKRVVGLGLSRDPERTPMQWDSSPNAGFCPPGVQPWLPIADDYAKINVSVERDAPDSMLTFTHKLIALRREATALNLGDYHAVNDVPAACFVYIRQWEQQRYLIALNFSGDEQTIRASMLVGGEIMLSTHRDRQTSLADGQLHLRGNEGCVIRLTAVRP